jgi:hypothetical protein
MAELHLENAARTLQTILNARDDGNTYIVSVREDDGADDGESRSPSRRDAGGEG